MNTLPHAVNEGRIAHHAAHQRERGGFVPELLPHPLEPAGDGPTRDPLPEPETVAPAAPPALETTPETEERAALEALMRGNATPVPAAAAPAPALAAATRAPAPRPVPRAHPGGSDRRHRRRRPRPWMPGR